MNIQNSELRNCKRKHNLSTERLLPHKQNNTKHTESNQNPLQIQAHVEVTTVCNSRPITRAIYRGRQHERACFMKQKKSTVSSAEVGFGAISSCYHMLQTQWPQKEQSANPLNGRIICTVNSSNGWFKHLQIKVTRFLFTKI